MLVNPMFLMTEEEHLRSVGVVDAYARLTVDREALVTNPFQVAANRLREMARNNGRHGSCGMGIGETGADFEAQPHAAITIGDLEKPDILLGKLWFSQNYKREQIRGLMAPLPMTEHVEREWAMLTDEAAVQAAMAQYAKFVRLVRLVDGDHLDRVLREPGQVTFEGAQGVLLDQSFGTFPFATRSTTTFENALDLLGDFDGLVQRIGVLRTYHTRHGAGPFVTEADLDQPERYNGYGPWQQAFRVGHFDLVAAKYAIEAIGGVDGIVLTHLDRVAGPQTACTAYDYDWRQPTSTRGQARLNELAAATEGLAQATPHYEQVDLTVELEKLAPIVATSHGPTARDKDVDHGRFGRHHPPAEQTPGQAPHRRRADRGRPVPRPTMFV